MGWKAERRRARDDHVADPELGISRPMLYRLLAKHELSIYARPGDREAYVDIDALRRRREQFQPRTRPQPTDP